MRLRESYSLYKRKIPAGGGQVKVVFYWQCYDEKGRRTCGHSTGQTTRTAANEFCKQLLKEGRLAPEKAAPKTPGVPTFAEYAEGWWDYETSEYLKSRKGRRSISRGYALAGRTNVNNYLNPAFGSLRLDGIAADIVDKWLTSFESRGLKRNTANLAFRILNVMLQYAVTQRIIKFNPCAAVSPLAVNDAKKIKILTEAEFKKMFPKNWPAVWDNPMHYIFNKLAALTGMRHGELLGLRGEFVFDTEIKVCAQYNHFGYTDTKNHKERTVPITRELHDDLQTLIKINGQSFLFSTDGGNKPIGRDEVAANYNAALEKIGISKDDRKARGLTIHSWRHFFNTRMVMDNINKEKVRAVTGHLSDEMTGYYTHVGSDDLTEVRSLQEKLLAPEPEQKSV
jgi:integrase